MVLAPEDEKTAEKSMGESSNYLEMLQSLNTMLARTLSRNEELLQAGANVFG